MSTQHTMSLSLRSLAICSCLALAAGCEKESKDTDGDSSATDGGGSTTGEGGSDPTEGSPVTSPATNNTNATNDTNATNATNDTNDTNDTNAQTCEGDWTLGSVPFSGDPNLGQACDDPVVPKNCADGTYIKFAATGECICIAECSSLGVSAGQNCTEDGSWVCAKIEATNASMNSATACVAKAWDLCTAGGSGGETASGGESASASGGDEEGSCAPSGASCSFSSDCCSDDCDFDDVCA